MVKCLAQRHDGRDWDGERFKGPTLLIVENLPFHFRLRRQHGNIETDPLKYRKKDFTRFWAI